MEHGGLSVKAENATFGPDPMPGYYKSLVVCYLNGAQQPCLAIAKENESINVSLKARYLKDQASLSSDWQTEISTTSFRNPSTKETITILGAVWGVKDVTKLARSFIQGGKKEFNELATNKVWQEDGWCHVMKTLVVFYQYTEIPMMSVVKETETMHFVISPPLFILGAAYGLEPVTQQVRDLVKNRQLDLTPNVNLPETWLRNYKSFVMVYQFGNEKPQLFISDEFKKVSIRYEQKEQEEVKINPDQLLILGAAYGLQDVTTNVKSSVYKNELVALVNNTLFGDDASWRLSSKTLVVVYQYGSSPPVVSITQELKKVEITKILPPTYGGLVDAKSLVDNNDIVLLLAVNSKYVTCMPNSDKLGAVAESSTSCIKLKIVQPDSLGPFFLKTEHSQVCAVDKDGYLILKDEQEATPLSLMLMLSTTGKVQLATTDNKFVRFAEKIFLKADTTEHFSALTSFQLAIDCGGNLQALKRPPSNDQKSLDLWLSFLWQVTEGFFLALGLEPFLHTYSPGVGLLDLIQTNENAKKGLQTLREELRPTTSATKAVSSAIHFLKVLWKEGIFWKVFKFIRLQDGVIIYTEIFARVIQVLLLPEAEATLLLAGFTTWALQLIDTSKKLEDL